MIEIDPFTLNFVASYCISNTITSHFNHFFDPMQVLVAITTPLLHLTKSKTRKGNKRHKRRWEKRWFKEVRIICCVAPRNTRRLGFVSLLDSKILYQIDIERVLCISLNSTNHDSFLLITPTDSIHLVNDTRERKTCVSNYDQIMLCFVLIFSRKILKFFYACKPKTTPIISLVFLG